MERSLKERIQTVLVQDFDGVWESFVSEHGTDDGAAFVRHLVEWQLIPAPLGEELLGTIPLPAEEEVDDANPEDATAIMHDQVEEVDPDSATRHMERPDTSAILEPDPTSEEFDPEAETVHLLHGGLHDGTSPPAPSRPPTVELGVEIDPEAETLHVDRRVLTPLAVEERAVAPSTLSPKPSVSRTPPSRPPAADLSEESGEPVGQDILAVTRMVRDPVLERRIMVRTLSAEAAGTVPLAKRFEREMEITSQLEHPGIPAVLVARGRHGYAMRAMDGRPLATVLAEVRASFEAGRSLPPSLAPQILIDRFIRVCEIVAYAHSRGVVHRDISPQNVLLGSFGGVWVVGWGAGRIFDTAVARPVVIDDGAEDPRIQVGTPGYMAPEQANGRLADLDARSDVYSLGLLLFEILTLRPAVTGSAPSVRLARQQHAQLDTVSHFYRQPIDPAFHAILATALAAHPADRYASPLSLGEDVRRALRGDPLSGRAERFSRAIGRVIGRYPGIVLMVMALTLAGWAVTITALLLGVTASVTH